MRKLIAGFATSLDGYIEGPKAEIDWIILDKEQFKELAVHWKKIDAMFHGRKTYEAGQAMQQGSSKMTNPFAHMKHYVFSNSLPGVADGFILVNGDIEKEVTKIKREKGKDIAIFGGAELACSLINLGLVDEIMLAVCPVLLGSGKPFFGNISSRVDLKLKETKQYASGLVSMTYTTIAK